MPEITDPARIEKKSFEIIDGLIGALRLERPAYEVVRRVVHATADPDFAANMVFSPGAVEAGVGALCSGCRIITDVEMLRAGISRSRPGENSEPVCLISDPEVAAKAKETGTTRASAAMQKAAKRGLLNGSIVAIGNAPTALFELIRLVSEGQARPALIVGVPVGFVGAAESKEALTALKGVPYITCRGRKGGSAVGAAIVNAIIKLTKSPSPPAPLP